MNYDLRSIRKLFPTGAEKSRFKMKLEQHYYENIDLLLTYLQSWTKYRIYYFLTL